MAGRASFALSVALSLAAMPAVARAEPDLRLRWPPRGYRTVAEDDPESDEISSDFTAEDTDLDRQVPKFRFEAWGRLTALVPTVRYKKGPQGVAHNRTTRRDNNLPATPLYGYRFILDVKFLPSLLVGIHYDRSLIEGPKRVTHSRGLSLQSRVIPGGSRVETLIDLQFGEAYLRWVIRDNRRVRIALGLGGAWASARIRVRGQGLRADGRIEDFFAPTISYHVALYPVEWLGLWVESSTSLVSLTRFPSLASNFRAGFRFPVGQHVELALALNISGGQIQDLDDLWGGKPTRGHRWKKITWLTIGGEVGVALRF